MWLRILSGHDGAFLRDAAREPAYRLAQEREGVMKLSVFRAVGATFAYFTGEIATLVRILWLPLILLGVGIALVFPRYGAAALAMMELGPAPDPAAAMPLVGSLAAAGGLFMLVFAIFYPMMFAGVMRHVIRGEKPKLPFYLSFGGDELRVLVTYVAVMIMLVLVYVVGVVALIVVSAMLALIPGAGAAIAGIVGIIGVIAFLCVLIWFALRMSLALPATIGARTIGIAKSWQATKGNVWRLLAFWVVWGVLFFAAQAVLMAVIMPDYFSDMARIFAAAGDPEAVRRIQIESLRDSIETFSLSSPKIVLTALAGGAYGFFMLGLWAAAMGVAYRYVAGETAPAR